AAWRPPPEPPDRLRPSRQTSTEAPGVRTPGASPFAHTTRASCTIDASIDRSAGRLAGRSPGRPAVVAPETDDGVPARGAVRVEAGPVRIDAAPADLGVALHAVPLDVAGRTALEVLTRGLRVLEQPERLRVVVPGLERAARAAAGLDVAGAAERLGVVAGRAVQVAAIRLGGVADHEVRGVETGFRCAGVALRAEGALLVAAGAALLVRGRGGAMTPVEADWVYAHDPLRRVPAALRQQGRLGPERGDAERVRRLRRLSRFGRRRARRAGRHPARRAGLRGRADA